MVSLSKMNASTSTMLTTYASFAASVILARSIANELLPPPLISYLLSAFRYLLSAFRYLFRPSSSLTIVVHEDSGMSRNQVYDDAQLYLSTKISPATARIGVSKTTRQRKFQIALENDQEIADQHRGVRLTWRLVSPVAEKDSYRKEKQFFELTFNSKSKEIVMESYLPYVMERAGAIREEEKVVKLYNRNCHFDEYDGRGWGSVILEHPSTFNTLAMDPDLKKSILDDLDRFVQRRDLYRRVGKAWKRGYLLYGPPGTGKSSLIAAMANYLKFDVYDLELTIIYDNSNLREVLLSTTNRSILVVEDIDCNKEARDRGNRDMDDDEPDYSKPKMTLSGLLNFIDGLWSSCGDERIIVFTTNRKDKLDPALLRPGRMDLHIHMSYCTFQSFKTLVSNYLGISITNHPLCDEIEKTMETTKVTPAEVAEELMKDDNADLALNGLLHFLNHKEIAHEHEHDHEHEHEHESGSESETESKVGEGVHVKKKSRSGRKARRARSLKESGKLTSPRN